VLAPPDKTNSKYVADPWVVANWWVHFAQRTVCKAFDGHPPKSHTRHWKELRRRCDAVALADPAYGLIVQARSPLSKKPPLCGPHPTNITSTARFSFANQAVLTLAADLKLPPARAGVRAWGRKYSNGITQVGRRLSCGVAAAEG
jgi:hypothetical protein